MLICLKKLKKKQKRKTSINSGQLLVLVGPNENLKFLFKTYLDILYI